MLRSRQVNFGQKLHDNVREQWKEYYIDYAALKRLLKQNRKQLGFEDEGSDSGACHAHTHACTRVASMYFICMRVRVPRTPARGNACAHLSGRTLRAVYGS